MNDHIIPAPPPDDTTFREWMCHLTSPHGATAEWPWLMREMLTAEFARQRALGFCYASEVFKDRDDDDPTLAVLPEKRAVKNLYHQCLEDGSGVFRITSPGSSSAWMTTIESFTNPALSP